MGGVDALDDPVPEVATYAAEMLGKFGSGAAEPALWRRYARWSHHWEGRESELSHTLADDLDARSAQESLGLVLMKALATGNGWLTGPTKLRSLKRMNKIFSSEPELERFMNSWDANPVTIQFTSLPPYFRASGVQYDYDSMDALERKLAQFPAGTKFAISEPDPDKSKVDR
jgi:hypothetical protein